MGRARLLTGQLVPATLQSQSAESSSESAEPAFRDSGCTNQLPVVRSEIRSEVLMTSSLPLRFFREAKAALRITDG